MHQNYFSLTFQIDSDDAEESLNLIFGLQGITCSASSNNILVKNLKCCNIGVPFHATQFSPRVEFPHLNLTFNNWTAAHESLNLRLHFFALRMRFPLRQVPFVK